jgi:starvation-inducible outer membrane lipoprotein
MQRMNTSTLCTAALAFGLTACASSSPTPAPTPPASERSPIMCTQDVMQCPDGRFVGRTPPGCAFVCAPSTAPAAR